MAKTDKDPKKQKATSDSLMRESRRKKAFAKTQANIAERQIRSGNIVKNSVLMGIDRVTGKPTEMPSTYKRMQMSTEANVGAVRDSIASVDLMPKGIRAAKSSPMPKPRKSNAKPSPMPKPRKSTKK